MLRKIIRRVCLLIIRTVKYMPFPTAMKVRNLCYRVALKKMGGHSNIADGVTIADPTRVSIGDYVSIHEYTFIGAFGEVTIGDYVMIATGCSIISDSHKFDRKDIPMRRQGITANPVIIGNNVWLGCNSVILGGVKIGDGAVIGAGAVVTRDIPENAVAVGVPCRVKRYR